MLIVHVCLEQYKEVETSLSIAQSKVMASSWTMSYIFVFLLEGCVCDFFLFNLYMVFIKNKKTTRAKLEY